MATGSPWFIARESLDLSNPLQLALRIIRKRLKAVFEKRFDLGTQQLDLGLQGRPVSFFSV